jgi:hypothetical protein
MNIDRAKARGQGIIHEQEALIEGKTSLSRADQDRFNALQEEFLPLPVAALHAKAGATALDRIA